MRVVRVEPVFDLVIRYDVRFVAQNGLVDVLDSLMHQRSKEDWVPADRGETEIAVEFILSGAILKNSDM